MDVSMIVVRLIHILGGIFWVGAMIFVMRFLMPAMVEAGPDGGKVMAGIMRRGYTQAMMVAGILVILSGLYLYWRVSAGFDRHYLESRPGHTYAFGGIFAIIAFTIGVSITRPAMMKATALTQSASGATGAEKDTLLAQAQALRIRGAKAGKIVMWLLILSTITMAIGRYV